MIDAVYVCALVAWSVALAWHDFRDHRLPDRLTLPAIPVALAVVAANRPQNLTFGVTAAVVLVVVGLLANRFADLGLGDVKLFAPAAFIVANTADPGASVTLWLLGTAVFGGVHAVIHLGITRDRRSHIAFGPSILGAMLASALTG